MSTKYRLDPQHGTLRKEHSSPKSENRFEPSTKHLLPESLKKCSDDLYRTIETIRRRDEILSKQIPRFDCLTKHIACNYFYETIGNYSLEQRRSRFFKSIRKGDKFIAKIINLFKRNAEIILIWSPRRDIVDLKIKANLTLNSYDNYEDWNLEVSDLVAVEVSHIKRDNQLELVRCHSSHLFEKNKDLINNIDDENDDEIDEDSIRNGKFRTIQANQMSFHDYLMDHNDLRNPSLVKRFPFISLLHSDCFINRLRYRIENGEKNDIRESSAVSNSRSLDRPSHSKQSLINGACNPNEKTNRTRSLKYSENESDHKSVHQSVSHRKSHSTKQKHKSRHKNSHKSKRSKNHRKYRARTSTTSSSSSSTSNSSSSSQI
ncbi:hypothetical protein SSS_02313 [Sarcoptes scabiei]|uniref:Uncharacterized protein n=1 Tax=Sarcoptes scabiei TaxID=52283 RepID=A0A834VAD7_SARSC|nr:hypothetical protein SSS_02313 [Sarcoptes scabiei]